MPSNRPAGAGISCSKVFAIYSLQSTFVTVHCEMRGES
jgi:hypothetical protein